MESYELEPRYTTNEIPGRCLKCLGEHEMHNCLMDLLRNEPEDENTIQKFEALVTFLQSSEMEQLRAESERLLSEGKQVKLRINSDLDTGKMSYELIVA
jgi:hypothetical protein